MSLKLDADVSEVEVQHLDQVVARQSALSRKDFAKNKLELLHVSQAHDQVADAAECMIKYLIADVDLCSSIIEIDVVVSKLDVDV